RHGTLTAGTTSNCSEWTRHDSRFRTSLMERLNPGLKALFGVRAGGKVARWDQIGISDPEHHRLTCSVDEQTEERRMASFWATVVLAVASVATQTAQAQDLQGRNRGVKVSGCIA